MSYPSLQLLTPDDAALQAQQEEGKPIVLMLDNTQDPRDVPYADLFNAARVELAFPKFSDGRAFSQAALLRQRLGYKGDIRATGDVLVDQLQMMLRTGFSSAVLRDDQSIDTARRQLARYLDDKGQTDHYQGDAVQPQPRFSRF